MSGFISTASAFVKSDCKHDELVERAEQEIEAILAEYGEETVARAVANVLPSPAMISGRELAFLVSNKPATQRALWASDMVRGRFALHNLSLTQAVGLTGASLGYAHTCLGLSETDRENVRRGAVRLAHFHNNRKSVDQVLDATVAKFGVEQIWSALDRATRPAAAE
jgi:hypothetical protein